MADRIIAPLALLVFIAFTLFLAVYINEIDLWIVIVLVQIMAIVDFWQAMRAAGNGNGGNAQE
ncbi:MAG: hypothetical protein D6826_08805 [Alphaproteobacteria bacterium]|nr:MAG: hypothetical protein D6826_08805 [Alphaproteobacteria bacterium]